MRELASWIGFGLRCGLIGVCVAAAACVGQGRGASEPDDVSVGPDDVDDETDEQANPVHDAAIAAGERMLERYRQAFEVRSIEALHALYAQDLDVTLVESGVRHRGWTAVAEQLTAKLRSADVARAVFSDVQVIAANGGALVVASIERTVGDETQLVTERGVVSLFLREELTGWVIAAEHLTQE